MNDYLADLILVLNNVVGMFVVVRFMNHLLVKKSLNILTKRFSLIAVLIVASILNIIFDNLLSNLWVGFLLFYLIGHWFYEGKHHIKVVLAIFIVVFSVVTELLTAILFGLVFGEVIQGLRENIRYLFLGGIVSKILLLLLIEVIIRFRKRSVTDVSLSSWLFIISIPVISLILSTLIIYEPVINNNLSEFTIISCVAILYIDIVAFYLFDNIVAQISENNEMSLREEQLLLQQTQYESIISGYDQVKKVRHDMLGHLIAIDGYLEKHKMDDAKSYIRQLHEEIAYTSRRIISGNVAVDAIINNRMVLAEKHGVVIVTDVALPKEMSIKNLDLSIIIGNLLTNAIEACQRLENEGSMNIQIGMKYRRNSLVIKVKNPFNQKSLKIQNGKFMSSKIHRKGSRTGVGINNVETVVGKYGGMYEHKTENGEFVVNIIIPDKKRGDLS